MIGRCLSDEKSRICELLKAAIDPAEEEALTKLFSEESDGMHWITQLKKAPKDFSYKEIVRESVPTIYHHTELRYSEQECTDEKIDWMENKLPQRALRARSCLALRIILNLSKQIVLCKQIDNFYTAYYCVYTLHIRRLQWEPSD